MSDTATPVDPHATVTVEADGRTLSGVGVTPEALQATIDARTPAEESSDAAPAPDPSAAASSPPASPKPTRGQARFSELTQRAKDAEAKQAAAEQKARELEARLSQPAASAPAAAPREAPTPPAPPPPTRPEPSEDGIGPGLKYETFGAFTRDQATWVWEQQQAAIDERVQRGIHGHQQAQQFLSTVERTRAAGRAVYADFDQLLQSGPGTYVAMPAAAVQAIFALPHSEHVQYAIMKDGALAQRLATLAVSDPYTFGLELAHLTPAATPASTGATGSAPLPQPVQPVGSGSSTTRLSSADHAKAGNYEAYKAARAAERGGRRR